MTQLGLESHYYPNNINMPSNLISRYTYYNRKCNGISDSCWP